MTITVEVIILIITKFMIKDCRQYLYNVLVKLDIKDGQKTSKLDGLGPIDNRPSTE